MGLVVRRRTTGVFYLGVIKPFDKFAHHFLISMPKKSVLEVKLQVGGLIPAWKNPNGV